jgi:hypothetical protein
LGEEPISRQTQPARIFLANPVALPKKMAGKFLQKQTRFTWNMMINHRIEMGYTVHKTTPRGKTD